MREHQDGFAVVGGGHAGAYAVATLRRLGARGPVHLFGDEPTAPYERPPLTKGVLTDPSVESPNILPPETWNDVHLHVGRTVTHLSADSREVVTDDDTRLRVSAVLLTTGGRARRLPVPGADHESIHSVRTIEDARRLRAALEDEPTVVVIGGGFLGTEVAASARTRGCRVTVLEAAPSLLARVASPRVGTIMADLHRAHGCDVRNGETVREIVLDGGRVRAVRTADGIIPADVVVVAVGMEPAVELAASAGARVDDGIVVDATCRTTVPGLYAAGDVARFPDLSTGRTRRVEQWRHAMRHGDTAAAAMLGCADPYEADTWFWSDQFGVNIQSFGQTVGYERTVARGSPEDRDGVLIHLDGDRVVGAIAFDRPRELRRLMALATSGTPVEDAVLEDETARIPR